VEVGVTRKIIESVEAVLMK